MVLILSNPNGEKTKFSVEWRWKKILFSDLSGTLATLSTRCVLDVCRSSKECQKNFMDL